MVYAGPYGIRGTVLSDQGNGIPVQQKEWGLFPLRDAEIDNQIPGAKPAGLKVSWLLLCSGMIHSMVLLDPIPAAYSRASV